MKPVSAATVCAADLAIGYVLLAFRILAFVAECTTPPDACSERYDLFEWPATSVELLCLQTIYPSSREFIAESMASTASYKIEEKLFRKK